METADRPTAATDRRRGACAPAERVALSIAEAAQALGISRAFAYTLKDRGELKTFAIGRRRMVSPSALAEFVAAREGRGA